MISVPTHSDGRHFLSIEGIFGCEPGWANLPAVHTAVNGNQKLLSSAEERSIS
jgi:hypothetical protein